MKLYNFLISNKSEDQEISCTVSDSVKEIKSLFGQNLKYDVGKDLHYVDRSAVIKAAEILRPLLEPQPRSI